MSFRFLRTGARAAFILALAAICAPTLATANPCERVASLALPHVSMGGDDQGGSGTGGTGILEPNGTGAGGTGIVAQEGTGAGGTGLTTPESEGGIGGTGIYGTVTGFGSVCVNGLKVEYDSTTPVEANGNKGQAQDLEIGQIVRIQTRADDPNWARGIEIESPLSGPVGQIDPERNRVRVMGAEVQLRPGAVIMNENAESISLDELRRGQHLEVSGLRRSDGVVMATRLDIRSAGASALVTDVATVAGEGTLYVGRVRSQLSSGEKLDASLSRARVQIRGTWNANTQSIEGATISSAAAHAEGAKRVSVQGYIARDSGAGDFKIAGTRVAVSLGATDETTYELDALVRVRGEIDENGLLKADRIVVEERGRAGMTIGATPPLSPSLSGKAKSTGAKVESVGSEVVEKLESLSPDHREEIEEHVEAARFEVDERLENVDRDEVEERVERVERDVRDRVERVERLERNERIEKIERLERDDRVERVEKEVRDRIDRYR